MCLVWWSSLIMLFRFWDFDKLHGIIWRFNSSAVFLIQGALPPLKWVCFPWFLISQWHWILALCPKESEDPTLMLTLLSILTIKFWAIMGCFGNILKVLKLLIHGSTIFFPSTYQGDNCKSMSPISRLLMHLNLISLNLFEIFDRELGANLIKYNNINLYNNN